MPPNFVTTINGKHISKEKGVPTLEDVAVVLSRIPMFAGSTQKVYSVAHHCLAVAKIMKHNNVYGLFHEVEVTVFGDCPGPVKIREMRTYEKRVRDDFIQSQGLQPITETIWKEVEEADQQELGGAARILGLKDAEKIWPTTKAIRHAKTITQKLLKKYPPEQQLQRKSPLVRAFIKTAQKLLREQNIKKG
ncbi:MAG: hypothetical protein Q7R96_02960 [Nanoarchaeota archaeon]|nr:hypothetical protein [Nanoarchaeota archaeon]